MQPDDQLSGRGPGLATARPCGCLGQTGNHKKTCSLFKQQLCTECGKPGHRAKSCGGKFQEVKILLPEEILVEVDAVVATLEIHSRPIAIRRMLIEYVVMKEMIGELGQSADPSVERSSTLDSHLGVPLSPVQGTDVSGEDAGRGPARDDLHADPVHSLLGDGFIPCC